MPLFFLFMDQSYIPLSTSATVTITVDTYVSVTNEPPRFLIMKEGMQEIEEFCVLYTWNFNEGCH